MNCTPSGRPATAPPPSTSGPPRSARKSIVTGAPRTGGSRKSPRTPPGPQDTTTPTNRPTPPERNRKCDNPSTGETAEGGSVRGHSATRVTDTDLVAAAKTPLHTRSSFLPTPRTPVGVTKPTSKGDSSSFHASS